MQKSNTVFIVLNYKTSEIFGAYQSENEALTALNNWLAGLSSDEFDQYVNDHSQYIDDDGNITGYEMPFELNECELGSGIHNHKTIYYNDYTEKADLMDLD